MSEKKKYKVVMYVAKSQYPKPLIKKTIEKIVESDSLVYAIIEARDKAYEEWDGVTPISAERRIRQVDMRR